MVVKNPPLNLQLYKSYIKSQIAAQVRKKENIRQSSKIFGT